MARKGQLGFVKLDAVLSEEVSYSADVTERKVEDGSPMSDHSSPNPMVISLEAVLVGDDVDSRIKTLTNYKNKGSTLNYRGRNFAKNMILRSFNTVVDSEIKNGKRISIDLIQVSFGNYKTVKTNVTTAKTKAKAPAKQKPKAKPVKKQPVKARATRVQPKRNVGRVNYTPRKVSAPAQKKWKQIPWKNTPKTKPRIKRERYVTQQGGLIEVY